MEPPIDFPTSIAHPFVSVRLSKKTPETVTLECTRVPGAFSGNMVLRFGGYQWYFSEFEDDSKFNQSTNINSFEDKRIFLGMAGSLIEGTTSRAVWDKCGCDFVRLLLAFNNNIQERKEDGAIRFGGDDDEPWLVPNWPTICCAPSSQQS